MPLEIALTFHKVKFIRTCTHISSFITKKPLKSEFSSRQQTDSEVKLLKKSVSGEVEGLHNIVDMNGANFFHSCPKSLMLPSNYIHVSGQPAFTEQPSSSSLKQTSPAPAFFGNPATLCRALMSATCILILSVITHGSCLEVRAGT